MDSVALVDGQIKAGQKLIERLQEAGIPLTAAGWIKPTERYQWYLYLVTPLVGEDRTVRPAARRIMPIVRAFHEDELWIDPSELMLVGPTEPTGEAIAAISRQIPPRRMATRYGGASLGPLSIDDAFIYALPPSVA